MPTKTLCVLANSKKPGGRCIAGTVVTYRPETQKWILRREWIRPVSHRIENAISPAESAFPNGRQPRLLDLVEIPFDEPAHVEGQPEDWLITRNAAWQHRGHFNADVLERLREDPTDLWWDEACPQDRATVPFVARHQLPSLYLIKPLNFRIFTERSPHNGQWRWRAFFDYRRRHYDFSLTDPVIQARYQPVDHGLIANVPEDVTALCISLGAAFQGRSAQPYHYKLCAAVFE